MCQDKAYPCPFPSGENEADYAGTKTRKRWAWEFLRRHPKFIEHCLAIEKAAVELQLASERKQAAEVGSQAARELARSVKAAKSTLISTRQATLKEFRLTRFKSFREDFDVEKPPLFSTRSVMVRENLTAKESREARTFPALAYGHVWIRFRLADTLDDEDALKAMIGTARRMLKEKRRKLLEAADPPDLHVTASQGAGPGDHYGRHLRFLDLKHAGLSDGQALKQVHAKSADEPSRKTRGKKGELAQALKMPEKYLDVLYGRHRKKKNAKVT